MLEYLAIASFLGTPIISFFLAKKGIKSGILDAYDAIMGDITSPETQEELKLLGKNVVSGAMGDVGTTVKRMFPKFNIQDAIGMLIMGYAQKAGLFQMQPIQGSPFSPQGSPTPNPGLPPKPIRPTR